MFRCELPSVRSPMYAHACLAACLRIYACVCMCMSVCMRVYVCKCLVCMYVCMRIDVCVHVSVMYLWIYAMYAQMGLWVCMHVNNFFLTLGNELNKSELKIISPFFIFLFNAGEIKNIFFSYLILLFVKISKHLNKKSI